MAVENDIDIAGLAIHGLWKDQNDERHISHLQEDGQIKLYCTRGSALRKWILHETHRNDETVLSEGAVDSAVSLIDSMCELKGKDVLLSVRVARLNDSICVDSISSTLVVDEIGWRNQILATPIFRRFSAMKPLATPVPGGDPKGILKFVNLKDELDQILFLTHLIFSFVPDIPHPILVLFGPQGASKSTAMKLYQSIIDPNVVSDIHTYSEMEFNLASQQRWVVGLDNVSGISPKFSDTLCKHVSGMGHIKRRLYTTDDMIAQEYMRVVLMNGVGLAVDRPDLMDRCLLISLERIDNSDRRDLASILKEFEIIRGDILGGCLDVLSKAMRIVQDVNLTFNTRMTDYARWGCAIAEALGYGKLKFIEALERNTLRQNEESLDASPIAAVINFCFSKTNLASLKGTATDILRELRNRADGAGIEGRLLPQTPRILGKKLMEIKPNLEAEGYKVFFNRGKERIWIVEPPQRLRDDYKSKVDASLASLPSLKPVGVFRSDNGSANH